jgi:hypothetical protein
LYGSREICAWRSAKAGMTKKEVIAMATNLFAEQRISAV